MFKKKARQAGCIQYDPVDVCGKNAELTLQSRIKGFKKPMLHDLLYKDRLLVDYPDKELSIWPTEDWPYFSSYRDRSLELGTKFDGLDELKSQAISYIRDNGPVCSDTLPIEGEIYWHSSMHWSGNWDKKSPAARTSPTPPIARTVARDSRKETVCFYVPIRVKI